MVTVFVSSEGLWFPEGVVVSYVSGSEHGRGVVVVAPALDGEYVLHQLFKVLAVTGQVQILGVDNQQRRGIVIMKKLRIRDRKSTRMNSSHVASAYAVFCVNKK